MAFVQTIGAVGQQTLLFNIEQAVGANGVNAPGDVRLVQYLLRAHYGLAAGGLAVDGWGGPTTNAWIKTFQEEMAADGNAVLVDGRFDRALGVTSSVSHTVYGIVLLNLVVGRNNPGALRALPREVELNPNPRANPYGGTRLVSMVRRTGDTIDVLYVDGTSETYIVREAFVVKAGGQTTSITDDGTYVRTADGQLVSIDQPTTPFWQ